MGSLDRRLKVLEARSIPEDELQASARRELLRRLTDDELSELSEPSDQAAALVSCPRFESRRCDCQCAAKVERGFAEHPELREEEDRRWQALLDLGEEILARNLEGIS